MSADRGAVVAEVEARVASENLRRHMLATEAIMRALAARLGEDADVWGLVGLAHDMDSEETEDDAARHGTLAAEALRSFGLPDEAVHAVAAHNPETGVVASERIDVALIAADQLSGLVTAAALVRPDKDLAGVKVKSVRERDTARGRSREAWTARPSPAAPNSASSSTTSSLSGSRRCRASPPSSASRRPPVDPQERRAPRVLCRE